MRMAITPLPWTVDYDYREDGVDQIVAANGLTICFMATPSEAHEDDAEFIVTACNEYGRQQTLENKLALANEEVVRLREALEKVQIKAIANGGQSKAWVDICRFVEDMLKGD